jgi:hypothetical protein
VVEKYFIIYSYITITIEMDASQRMNMMPSMPTFNFQEIIARAIKYLIEGLAVAVAAYFIPRKKMNLQEIIMIALSAAATFAILDLYAPSVGIASRQGAGFGIGASMTGFGGIAPGLPGVPAPLF